MNEEEKAIKFLENKTTNYSLSSEALHYYSILYYLIINLQKKNKQLQEQLKQKEALIKKIENIFDDTNNSFSDGCDCRKIEKLLDNKGE